MGRQFDGLTLVALGFLFLAAINILQDRSAIRAPAEGKRLAAQAVIPVVQAVEASVVQAEAAQTQVAAPPAEASVFVPPYDHYVLTQGVHGFSYGHMAIDISGGKGATIYSPINGWVSAIFIDDYGNTWIIIENEVYQVILLHGLYSVNEGDVLSAGQAIGVESNQGNTVDGLGRSCRNRDCGYHTHLNVFNKLLGSNVNPLDLIPPNR